MARIIVGQQLSIASANAIYTRLQSAVSPLTADGIEAATDDTLAAAGLSRGKIATLRALATAANEGRISFGELAVLPAERVHAQLTSVRGIGPWTADIYLMFCRNDADAFAAGDLALQLAAQALLDLSTRPTAEELALIARRWCPHRALAASLLWSYYGHLKARRKPKDPPVKAKHYPRRD